MKLSQFRFDLPLNLIAQNPAKRREDARMMVVHRHTGEIENKHFRDILDYYDDKDVFVVNNTKVFPARMYGRKEKTEVTAIMMVPIQPINYRKLTGAEISICLILSINTIVFQQHLMRNFCINEMKYKLIQLILSLNLVLHYLLV